MHTPSFPSIIDPQNPFVDVHTKQGIAMATKGDPNAFKRTSAIISIEPLAEIDDALRNASVGVNSAKVGSDIVRARRDLLEIIQICKSHDVTPYLGGGVMETAMAQNSVPEMSRVLQDLGLDTVEISNSDGTLSTKDYQRLIRDLRRDFTTVLVEIGAKSKGEKRMNYEKWTADMKVAMDTDASRIILEGSGSGRCGIYDGEGNPKGLLVSALVGQAEKDFDKIVIEAPWEQQQNGWFANLGWDVRLGNVPLRLCDVTDVNTSRVDEMTPEKVKDAPERRNRLRQFVDRFLKKSEKKRLSHEQLDRLMQVSTTHFFNSEKVLHEIEEEIFHILDSAPSRRPQYYEFRV